MKFFLKICTCFTLIYNLVLPSVSIGIVSTFPTIISWTTAFSIVSSVTGAEEDDESQFPLRRHTPFYNAELYKVLRQHYKFQDFLWAGSGEGPVPSENQDGMAWEDDDLQTAGKEQIKVTKTMVLYKTVLSTIYPVAMTPVIVTSQISPTIELSVTLATDIMSFPSPVSITPTATLPPIFVQPTVTGPPLPDSRTEHPDAADPSESLNDRLSASATDPRFWIQTSIKRKRDGHHPNDLVFHELMQSRLAAIYAAAFKRQLLKSLRLMGQQEKKKGANETIKFDNKRGRRSLASFENFDYNDDVETTNPLYFFLRDQSATARTAMNVSVSMINVTWAERNPKVQLRYIVYAEGSPIQGFVAVRELQVMSKKEMEDKLGYEIIEKAEAIVQPLERNEIASVASTTPWLIVLMALVCLMILILMLTLFMTWKWRHNRLRDRQSDRLQTVSEDGALHHASPSSGQAILASPQESYSGDGKKVVLNSPSSSVFRTGHEREIGAEGMRTRPHLSKRDVEALEPDYQRSSPDDKSSSSMLINPSEGSSYHSHSPQKHSRSKSSSVARKVHKRRRSKRLHHTRDLKSPSKSPLKSARDAFAQDERDFSFTGDICRNMDKIAFGNLDVYADSEARTPSAQAKKILSRPSSHEMQKSQAPDPHKSSGSHVFETEVETHEQDRDLSEKSFDASEAEETDKNDAEVQTPTRLKSRRSPRVRTSPRHRSSRGKAPKMSLISTESEEAVEFRNLRSSYDDINPIGRIRKRFHQFLDDAFNVMATGRKDTPGKCPQSAKVTVTHQMKSTTPSRRPWTSHVIREESVRKVRPKSSVGLGLTPKPAWTVGSERRCQSAKSKTSILEEDVHEDKEFGEAGPAETKEGPMLSSRSSSTLRTDCQQSLSEASHSHTSYVFPKYPTYPEMDVCMEHDPNWVGGPETSQRPVGRLHPLDPAVPLIEAIKDEMKRFEKVKVSSGPSKKI